MLEGRRWLISTDVHDPDDISEDGSIDNDGDALFGEDESGSGELDVSTCVT